MLEARQRIAQQIRRRLNKWFLTDHIVALPSFFYWVFFLSGRETDEQFVQSSFSKSIPGCMKSSHFYIQLYFFHRKYWWIVLVRIWV